MSPRYGSRRADCPGYLEFIWRETGAENPQAIAYINSKCGRGPFYGHFRDRVFKGSTVCEVKDKLFPAMDAAYVAEVSK